MKAKTAQFFDERMSAVVRYALGEWKGAAADDETCYWTGHTTEMESFTRQENGAQKTSMILRGYTRGSLLLLEQEKEKIEKSVPCTTVLEDGTGVVITYKTGMIVPTGVADLKSMKIDMDIQEWRTDL